MAILGTTWSQRERRDDGRRSTKITGFADFLHSRSTDSEGVRGRSTNCFLINVKFPDFRLASIYTFGPDTP
ncbi:MAG TPA: hypothetical protein VN946_02460 [Terriglobales bacterium]|jgi:hypothetical protein|nr:hypothetical protein [Terriglobales bacterium]